MPFVKLDRGILTSTIWCLRPELEIFMTALLMAEPREYLDPTPTIKTDSLENGGWDVPPGWYGFVPAAGPGIVRAAHVDDQLGTEALKRLASPEPESRSQEFEGRRMVRINGGYLVLNFMRYRDYDHSAADRMRRLRARKKDSVTRNGVSVRANVTHSREQKAEADKTKTVARASAPLPDSEWLQSLETDPAYKGILVSTEVAKCRVWSSTQRKPFTRRRIVAWLNRVEKPVGYNGQTQFAGGFAPNVAVLVEPEPKGWREAFPDFLGLDLPWAKIEASSRAHICKEMARLEESSFG